MLFYALGISQSIGEKRCRMYVQTTDRTARITDIIAKRRPLADKIAGTQDNLKSLASALDKLEVHRKRLLKEVEPDIKERLNTIDFSSLESSITTELEVLDKLRGRFSRNTLNIGVVGRMRQGKSTLLQSLSGLDNDVIPAHSGGACTAVRSTICPRFNAETEAKVTFHSEDSLFKEVILSYYTELKLTPIPASFSDFVNSPLPDKPSSATNEAMYQRLKHDYYSNQAVYRDLLGASQLTVPRHKIQDYVTHANGAGSFKSLAVQEVKIYCLFPNSEVGQIALVDIPGLGDLKVGDEKLMLETLGQEVDVVLFVRRPDPHGDDWKTEDTDLYDKAAEALNDLSERSFFVLNQLSNPHDESKNACERFKQRLDSGQLGIKVVDCIIADCSDPQQANHLLDRVLKHLEKEIIDLDTKYAESCQERLIQLQSAVKAELDNARNSLGQEAQPNKDAQLFVPLFNQLWKNLKNSLQELLKELRKQRDEVDTNFKEKVDEAIQNCRKDTGIPSTDKIEIQANSTGGYPNAYYQYLPEIRAHLSHKFLSLDEGLKLSLEQVKSQVTEVLVNQGRLGRLTKARGSDFLREMVKLLPGQLIPGEPSKLKFGFQLLAEFELSYRGFVQHRIRQHLDGLTPNEPATLQLSTSPSVQQVFINLKTAHAEAVYQCENALENLLSEPSQAAFAIVEEFVDRILRAEDVESEWRIFLDDVRSEVWPDEFKHLHEQTRMRREWLDTVERIAQINHSNSMQFLN
jgi:GTPase Era involved in 16S rRNA processing